MSYGTDAVWPPPSVRADLLCEVQAVLADVLDIPLPAAHVTFAQLGGTSLAAAVVLAQLRDNTGIRLALDALSPESTASTLADRLLASHVNSGVA